jgi:hypothetical protein
VALLNPKTYIFFAAFLPQFISADAGYAQLAVLGVVGPSFAAFTDLAYAIATGLLGERMAGGVGNLGWTKWVCGAVFIGLGIWALWMGRCQPGIDDQTEPREERRRCPRAIGCLPKLRREHETADRP